MLQIDVAGTNSSAGQNATTVPLAGTVKRPPMESRPCTHSHAPSNVAPSRSPPSGSTTALVISRPPNCRVTVLVTVTEPVEPATTVPGEVISAGSQAHDPSG